MLNRALFLAFGLTACAGVDVAERTWTVCPEETNLECDFTGGDGLQGAVDAAHSGDTILVKAGEYVASAYRDVPYKIHTVRGFVVVENKQLTIKGEPGATLDGSRGLPTTALIVHDADVDVSGLTIKGFRFDEEEDEIYEGHGIFVIDGRLRADDVTISHYQKMALIGRGDSLLDVSNINIVDGHVAIWLHESAYLRMRDSIVSGNDGSAVAAYDNTVTHISGSVFDNNMDDALYSEHNAAIYASNSLLLNNKPYAARALNNSLIWMGFSAFAGNAEEALAKDQSKILYGPNIVRGDLRLNGRYQPQDQSPLIGAGDPDMGGPGNIGLPE